MDITHLQRWIGQGRQSVEAISPQVAERFLATFDRAGSLAPGDPAPLLIHFCLAPPVAPMGELGRDGHPARGGFLPPVPLPRRMWAGGAFDFHAPPRIGDEVTRVSTITNVVAKQGRTGPLCFVELEHRLSARGQLLLIERQDLVFRGDATEGAASADREAGVPAAPTGETRREVVPTPTLLFRYSALTFNGHRIHYDAPYAREVEGYPGLVVHGPLLATLLCQFAADLMGETPRRFEFRSLSTLYDDQPFTLHASPAEDGLDLWAARPGGPVAMRAKALTMGEDAAASH